MLIIITQLTSLKKIIVIINFNYIKFLIMIDFFIKI